MKIKTLKAIIVLCMSHSSHAFDCNTDASQIDDVIRIPSDHSGYKVISTGRSYFYTAPSLNCIDKEKFLIKGDTVDAYLDHGKFTLVLFINPKTGKDTSGWMLTRQLKATGYGMGPTQTE